MSTLGFQRFACSASIFSRAASGPRHVRGLRTDVAPSFTDRAICTQPKLRVKTRLKVEAVATVELLACDLREHFPAQRVGGVVLSNLTPCCEAVASKRDTRARLGNQLGLLGTMLCFDRVDTSFHSRIYF